MNPKIDIDRKFEPLLAYLERLPAIGRKSIGFDLLGDDNWWIKFSLKTDHHLAWRHVQEIGHVLNYLSLKERLPCSFYPVSPPPYMNGGIEFLSWVIESDKPEFTPTKCAEWLEGRLPRPVDDASEWILSGDE